MSAPERPRVPATAAEPEPNRGSPAEEQSVPPADADGEYRCDLCGAPMLEWHCRIICNHCGYQRDCSDP